MRLLTEVATKSFDRSHLHLLWDKDTILSRLASRIDGQEAPSQSWEGASCRWFISACLWGGTGLRRGCALLLLEGGDDLTDLATQTDGVAL